MRNLSVTAERFPIAGAFTISRGSKTSADVLTCEIRDGTAAGRGECVPYARYGETLESVARDIEGMAEAVASGIGRLELLHLMKPGAARNAIDCALWDLDAKTTGRRVAGLLGEREPHALETAYTLSLGEPEAMHAQARQNAWRPLLKVKVGTEDDAARMRAVVSGAPDSRFILDANEGWNAADLERNLALAEELGIALIEQPVKAGQDALLGGVSRKVPLCADESVHTAADLDRLAGLYDCVNIKLDKAGGLTAALELREAARQRGLLVMVGCMVGTSLAMAPAVLLAQDADFVDLDGPLLLARDRDEKLAYEGSMVSPPDPSLWG
ncbi:MAG: dipeptide epimerase [Rhizobiales bacterium]|nr:dipeptide epimerase [Hyphomicrobiales bacterium]